MEYRNGIFIVVYRKDKRNIKYLLLKRKLHWKGWEFPKGGIKKSERLIQAVKRELLEETGQKAVKIKKFNVGGKYKYDKEYPGRLGFIGQSWNLFSAEVKSGRVKLDKKEHSSYKWLDFNQSIKLLKWKNQKECLKLVNSYLNRF